MLQCVELTNFKCFEKQQFDFTNLTILTGVNGMGKSSLLQSLLLLRQSNDDSGWKRGLKLNGRYVSLGSAQDILYEEAADDLISVAIKEDGQEDFYQFSCASSQSDELPLLQSHFELGDRSIIFSDRFTYLSAYRIAPMPLYHITNEADLKRRDFGTDGEFALQYLKLYGGEAIPCGEMVLGDPENTSLSLQVQAWMNLISPGVLPIINVNPQTRTAELYYEFIQGTGKTNTYKSANVGFGITYVLPVIVALLSAHSGALVLIENPEAHLHPKGQRYLGELIARAAAGGVQILLETHSDHVLNGVRIAARNAVLDANDVTLAYFTMGNGENGDYKRRILQPKLLQNGQIDQWPEGFFDEWDNSLLELL